MLGAALTVSAKALLAVTALASCTRTVKLNVPAVVGVPLTTPAVERLNPGGVVPDHDHVKVPVPVPGVASKAGNEDVCPTVSAASGDVVKMTGAALITSSNTLLAVWGIGVVLSLTETVKL
jgi:hypothetical protein